MSTATGERRTVTAGAGRDDLEDATPDEGPEEAAAAAQEALQTSFDRRSGGRGPR